MGMGQVSEDASEGIFCICHHNLLFREIGESEVTVIGHIILYGGNCKNFSNS